jgi:glucose dehydrogenase
MKRISISILILCASFASVAWAQQPASRADWTEFHRLNMMRFNPHEQVLNVNNVGTLGLKWSYSTGGGISSSPAVVNGVVYVSSNDGNVYAFGLQQERK